MAPMALKESFAVGSEVDPLYTGGPAALAGDVLATAIAQDVQISNVHTGARMRKITGDTEPITAIAITPNAEMLITCSRSLLLKIYKLSDGSLVRQTKAHESPVTVICTDSTSNLVATGGAEGTVKVWDIQGGYVTHNFKGHGGVLSALKFFGQAGGSVWRLASGADDCKVRIWDLVSNKCLAILDGHVSVVRGLDFSEDGSTLVSGSRDQVVNIWDLNSFTLKDTIPVFETLEVVGFLKPGALGLGDEQYIFTGGNKNAIRFWSPITKAQVHTDLAPEQTTETIIRDIIYNSIESTLTSICSNQTILVQTLQSAELEIVRRIVGHFDEIIDCTYVGHNAKTLAIGSNSEDVFLMDVETSNVDVLSGHTDIVITLDRDFSGMYLVTGAKDNTAKLWSVAKQSCIMTFEGHTESVGAVALPRTPSDEAIPEFVITGAQDRTIKLWETAGGGKRAKWTIKAHDKDINAIDLSPNDQFFASASQDRLCKIWERETGEIVGVLRGHKRGVWTVKFSQFEKVLATGSGDRSVKLWSLNDFTCLKTFEGHTNSVLKLLFMTSGLQIASAGGDGLVKIWTIKTGECETTLDNHIDRVWSLALSADEKVLVSGGGDSVITFWNDTTAMEKEREQKRMADLIEKEQELSNYVHNQDWRNAIVLALSLDRPGKLFALFSQVVGDRTATEGSISGMAAVDEVLATLSRDQLTKLLDRLRDWNTNARSSTVAQQILHCLLNAYGPEEFLLLPNIKPVLDALIPYSERHYKRMNELVQDSYLVDYTLREMVDSMDGTG